MRKITFEEAIKALKEGKRVYLDKYIYYYMEDGYIIYARTNIDLKVFNTVIRSDYAFYLNEPEDFKITETGLYKTRDGRRAYVYDVGDVGCNYFIQGESLSCYRCSIYGIYSTDPNKIDEDDIISKWGD